MKHNDKVTHRLISKLSEIIETRYGAGTVNIPLGCGMNFEFEKITTDGIPFTKN